MAKRKMSKGIEYGSKKPIFIQLDAPLFSPFLHLSPPHYATVLNNLGDSDIFMMKNLKNCLIRIRNFNNLVSLDGICIGKIQDEEIEAWKTNFFNGMINYIVNLNRTPQICTDVLHVSEYELISLFFTGESAWVYQDNFFFAFDGRHFWKCNDKNIWVKILDRQFHAFMLEWFYSHRKNENEHISIVNIISIEGYFMNALQKKHDDFLHLLDKTSRLVDKNGYDIVKKEFVKPYDYVSKITCETNFKTLGGEYLNEKSDKKLSWYNV